MKKTKLVALGLAAALVFGMVGCGNTDTKEESKETTKTESPSTTTSETTKTEEKEEPMVISMGIMQGSNILDYEDNLLTNAIEEQMNVELDIMLLPNNSGDWGTKVTLMATSDPDSMPDMLMADGNLGSSMQLELGEAGVFTPIEDYIFDEKIMPNFNNNVPEHIMEEMLAVMQQADGHIYGIADHTANASNNCPEKLFINTAWLEKLGLEVPETTEQLKEALLAMRDKDPNGNGVADEIGVYGRRNGWGQDTLGCLMNSFTSWNISKSNSGLALDQTDGKTVTCPFIKDEWKQGIMYMHDLYEEGVFAASMFTDDDTTYKATINLDPAIVGLVDMADLNWITTAEIRDQYEYVLPFEGPTGVSWLPARSPSFNVEVVFTCEGDTLMKCLEIQDQFFVDPSTNDPDQISVIMGGRGIYGEHWTDDPAIMAKTSNLYVELGLCDEMSYVNLKKKDQQTNFWWGKMHAAAPIAKNGSPWYGSGNYYDGVGYDFETATDKWKVTFFNAVEDPKYQPKVMPILQYTLDERDEVGDARSDIGTYQASFMAECITGVRDCEKEWDAYVKEIYKMGLEKWLEVAQRIYDRQTS